MPYLSIFGRFPPNSIEKGHQMRKLTVLALRIVLAGLLAGSLFVQAVMVPIMAIDLADAGEDVARRARRCW